MKRMILVLCIVFLASGGLFALDTQAESADRASGDGFQIRSSLGLAFAVGNTLISPDAALVHRTGILGAGAGLKGYVGTILGDSYAAPYVTGELGWFSLDAGYLFQITPSSTAGVNTESDLPLYLSAAFFPSIPLGPGRLTLGTSLDLAVTDFQEVDSGDALGDLIGTIVVGMFSLFKWEIAVGYRFFLD